MEVVLLADVDKIGKGGSVVKVKDGFARNFLIPNNLAVAATSANLKKLEQDKQKKNVQLEKVKKESVELKARLANVSLTIPALVKEGEDVLYGSVTAQDISAALKEEGFEIDKTSILLDEPLKALGIFEAPIRLNAEVLAKVKVWIVKK